jgi:hypothetical protein
VLVKLCRWLGNLAGYETLSDAILLRVVSFAREIFAPASNPILNRNNCGLHFRGGAYRYIHNKRPEKKLLV